MSRMTRLRTPASILAVLCFWLGSQPVAAQPSSLSLPPGISIAYAEPRNPAHRPLYERLKQRQVLEQVLYELRLRFVEAAGGGKRIIEP
jgi:hypothetical protein